MPPGQPPLRGSRLPPAARPHHQPNAPVPGDDLPPWQIPQNDIPPRLAAMLPLPDNTTARPWPCWRPAPLPDHTPGEPPHGSPCQPPALNPTASHTTGPSPAPGLPAAADYTTLPAISRQETKQSSCRVLRPALY